MEKLDVTFHLNRFEIISSYPELKLITLFEGSKTVFDGFKAFQLTLKSDRRSSRILNFLLAGNVIIVS